MTTDPLQAVITALGAKLQDLDGLARWYADPPEALNEFPCGLAYVSSGELTPQAHGWGVGLHTIVANIYHSRQILPESIDGAKVWPYRVLTVLAADLRLSNTVETLVARPPMLRYTCGPLQYNADIHYGVSFQLTVKILDTLTVG